MAFKRLNELLKFTSSLSGSNNDIFIRNDELLEDGSDPHNFRDWFDFSNDLETFYSGDDLSYNYSYRKVLFIVNILTA